MFAKRPQVRWIWVGSEERGLRAKVRLRAQVPGEARVEFVFGLRRPNVSARWRIDAARMQESAAPSAEFIRFLLAPNIDCLRFIHREALARERAPTGFRVQ